MLLELAIFLSAVSLSIFAVWPVAGIALLFLSKPVIDTTFAEPLFYGIHLTEIVGALVPVVVSGHLLFARPEQTLRRMPLRWIWMIYAADVCFFSFVIGYNNDILSGANVFLRYINGVVGFYMVQSFFHHDHEKNLKKLLMALIIGGGFPMGLGVYQMMTGKVWIPAETEGITRYVGLYHDAFTVRYYAFQTIFALLLYGALYAKRSLLIKIGAMAYCAASTVAMIGAYSKAGTVSLAMWIMSWTLLQKKIGAFLLIILFGGVLGIYYVPRIAANIAQMFHKEIGAVEGNVKAEKTFAGRWYSWEDMMSRWERFNWLKKGFGSGEVALGAHNDYIQMLFHGGILGVAIYLLLLCAIGMTIVSHLRAKIDPISVAALMLLLMWLVDTIGLVPSSYPGYQWFVWGFIGLSLRLRAEKVRASVQRSPARDAEGSKQVYGGVFAIPPANVTKRRIVRPSP